MVRKATVTIMVRRRSCVGLDNLSKGRMKGLLVEMMKSDNYDKL
jgi:hypothetical protein